ncbi:MAG: hypothetical protein ABI876_09365 [Bacteroidota bacterium]
MNSACKPAGIAIRFLLAAVALFAVNNGARAQVLEMRHVWERFSNWKVIVSGEAIGPIHSELAPTARVNIPFDTVVDVNGSISLDYWQMRGGLKINAFSAISPFLFWNPQVGRDGFGTDSSRWSASIGWEGIFASDRDFSPTKNLQSDNSIFSPKNAYSLLVSYWFGEKPTASDRAEVIARAYPDLDPEQLRRWMAMRNVMDTNYSGRGFVDTNNYRTLPLDTNSYVRGFLPPNITPIPVPVRYVTRKGLSVALGLGTGKYSGSGPISKYLNLFYTNKMRETSEDSSNLAVLGMNPMLAVRYRYKDYIGEVEIAGEDVNLALVVRSIKDFDLEVGAKHLEHSFYRPSRGPNRPELFLGVRYAPPFRSNSALYERGEDIYMPEQDSDGDGIPDGVENSITHTDPNNADTDGDGLSDGLEVNTYKTNPLVSDSDGDGLSDGQEILTPGRRTDPLRADTDEDGISDGQEVLNGTDPLIPAGGERGR